MTDELRTHALSFGGAADAYERGRPTYPVDAALWMTSDRPAKVLELGAGTGKLTGDLLRLGHEVHATDPDEAMLDVLQREVPGASTAVGTAEQIAAPDRTYDVVVAAQCFHWFDLDRALPEIARVLRPGGRLSVVWNERDERIPWVKKLGRIIGTQDQLRDPSEPLAESELFTGLEAEEFKFRQLIDRHSIQDLVTSRSNIAALDEAERAARMTDVLALYDDYGRGMDGMQLPYFARCFRATVVELVITPEDAPVDEDDLDDADRDPMSDTMPRGLRGRVRPATRDGAPTEKADDDQMILIDFR